MPKPYEMPAPEFWDAADFYNVASLRKRETGERFGQACFNLLLHWAPEIAEIIRGTMNDPFYAQTVTDPRIYRFDQEVFGNGSQ